MTNKFLKTVFNGVDSGFINIWTLQDKKSHWFSVSELDEIQRFVDSNQDKDVYYGVGLRAKQHGTIARGKNEDVSCITCFWSDIDIKGSAHKQQDLPETMAQVTEFLDSLEQKPSIIVGSGNGVHAYWLFDKPVYIGTAEHRDNVQRTLQGFQKYINDKAKERGWKLDNTSDLARVLRLVGSVNQKNGSACVADVYNDVTYKRSDFSIYNSQKQEVKVEDSKARQDFTKFTTGKADKCIDNCLFMAHCRDNADKLPEPEWHAMISNLSLASDGVTVCHELSSKYKGYSKSETESKVQRARKECKPHTCRYIQDSLRFDCGECCATVKAPIGLAVLSGLEKAKDIVSRELSSLDELYQDDVMDSLAYLKQHSMKDYTLFKSGLKAKFKSINLVEFEKAVTQQANNKIKRQSSDCEKLELNGIELSGANMPDNYIVDMNGIKKLVQVADNIKVIPICNCPIVIAERYVNLDTNDEKVGLAYFVDKRWKKCIGDRAEVFNKATLLKFSNKGLKVSTTNASELVSYLDIYEGVNMENIQIKKSIDRLGWVGDKAFFPYVTKDITFEEDSNVYDVYQYAKSEGNREKWLDLMTRARVNPYARFMVATSATSPLISKMGVRNFVMHMWDDSKAGKSAMLKLAISIWGNPDKLMGTFSTTEVGIEQRAATLNNLPLGIDEKQVANDKKLDLERVVYMLCAGETKTRGQKSGGIQTKRMWRNIAMSTGEEPLLKGNAKDGSTNRCMQINGKPIEDEAFGKEIHNKLTRHYGYGGSEIIAKACDMLAKDSECIEDMYLEFSAKFSELGFIDSYADYCAAICVGDVFVSTILYNTSNEVAKAEAFEMAMEVYKRAASGLVGSNSERAVDFVQGWLVSNINRFEPDSTPCYGKVESTKFSVIPEYMHKALEESGFTPSTAVKALTDKHLLVKNMDSNGKNRTKKNTNINGVTIPCYVIELESNNIKPLIKG